MKKFIILGLLFTIAVHGQDTFLPLLKERSKPTLDGVLSENEWKDAATVNNFFRLSSGNPAKFPTTVKMYHDARYLYFGIECTEPAMKNIVTEKKKRDFNVWDDDCVEIFLSSSGSGSPYYQFIITAGNIQGDLKCENGLLDLKWDGQWESAVKHSKNGWTAEVAIPIVLFGKPKGNTWRIAIARENKASKELSSWPYLETNFHNISKYAILNGVQFEDDIFLYNLEGADFIDPRENNGRIYGKIKFMINSFAEKNEKMRLTLTDGKNYKYSDRLQVNLKKGMNSIEIPVVLEAAGRYTGKLVFSNAVSAVFEFKADSAPFEAGMYFPRYRNYIFDSMNLAELKIEIKPKTSSKQDKISVLLTNAGGKQFGEIRDYEFPSQKTVIAYPVPVLAYGQYILEIKTGNFSQKILLEKVKSAEGTPSVWFDENNVLSVNGEKIFPFGFYWSPPAIENYLKSGFNAVFDTGGPTSPEVFAERQRYLSKNGIISFATNRYLFDNSKQSGKTSEYALNMARKIFSVNSPMLCGWYTADEPDLQTDNELFMKEVVDTNRKMGGLLPQIIVYNQASGTTLGSTNLDVIAIDPYLGFRYGENSPSTGYERISSSLDAAVKASGNRRPAWAVIECYPAGYYGNYAGKARYPTIGEIRLMTYLAIIHGAKGIFYWDNSVLAARKLYPAMKEFATEIKELTPLLTAPPCDAKVILTNGVHAIERSIDGKTMVIAANPRPESITAEIPVSYQGILKVMSGGRSIKVTDGIIRDSIPPYGVCIYTNFSEGSTKFAETLKAYRLEDSYIGHSSAENLADVWSGAKFTCTDKSDYRNGIESIDGAYNTNWVSNGKPGTYTVTLSKTSEISRIRLVDPSPDVIVQTGLGGTVKAPEILSRKEFYIYWDDTENLYAESVDKPDVHRFWKVIEYELAPVSADSTLLTNLHSISEIQVFEK